MSKEMINHPDHYNGHPSGVEAIDICERIGFNLGNAFKYIYRAGNKFKAVEDLKKAIWYIEREIDDQGTPDYLEAVRCIAAQYTAVLRYEPDKNKILVYAFIWEYICLCSKYPTAKGTHRAEIQVALSNTLSVIGDLIENAEKS